MQVREAAARSGVTIKAVKYYESIGLVKPSRLHNGYREFGPRDVDLIKQVRDLTAIGLSVKGTRPFIDCLKQGHVHGDDCPESLAAYHHEIDRLDALVRQLSSRRQMLQSRLFSAASRGFPESTELEARITVIDRYGLPEDLPVPIDDGSAAHLVGQTLPRLTLVSTTGGKVSLDRSHKGRWLIFVYPTTGVPGVDMPRGWDEIPGARGCTPEACGFRDNFAAILNAGLDAVYGLSSQGSEYQKELAARLQLPYAMLSDPTFALREQLTLPTFEAGGSTFYKRLTLVIRGRTIEHVFFPIFPPNEHAINVLSWIRENPSNGAGATGKMSGTRNRARGSASQPHRKTV
jgi:peroxiredoxin/DNA-binding transcriptional MerR regulator